MMKGMIYTMVIVSVCVSVYSAGCNVGRSSPVYKQCDSQWGSKQLGSSSTICKVGCLMCSVASALTGLGKVVNSQTPTPGVLNEMLRGNNGYQGNLYVWTAVERYGIKYIGQFNQASVLKQALCDKKVVILLVNNGGHWVLATGYEGDTFYVNDSGYNRGSYSANEVVLGGIYNLA